MKKNNFLAFAFCAISTLSFAQTTLIKKTVIGGEGGWDYLYASSPDRKLYLSHSSQVEVLNLDTHEKIGVIPDTKGVHGIVTVPALGKGFITCGRTNSVIVFEIKTLAKIAEIPTGQNPDALLYDKFSNRVFVFNHKGGSVTAIDAQSLKAIETVKLGGSAAEAGVTDEKGTIFVNLEDLNEIISLDAKTLAIKKHYKIGTGEEPTGLAIDSKRSRLIAVCGNRLMVILNISDGKVIAEVPIGGGCDGVAFDPSIKTAFSSNGEGTISVVKETTPMKYEVIETIKSRKGARTITFDDKTHHVYTISAEYGEIPLATIENPHPRPKVLPGTYMVLEFGQK